jgi:hypothetical protein
MRMRRRQGHLGKVGRPGIPLHLERESTGLVGKHKALRVHTLINSHLVELVQFSLCLPAVFDPRRAQ